MNKLIVILSLAVLSGCSSIESQIMHKNLSAGRALGTKLANAEGTDRLQEGLDQHAILVTTLTDISQIKTSTAIAQMASEEIMSGLESQGFRVVDAKVGNSVMYRDARDGGEFLLSREVTQVAAKFQTKFVVVGTYTTGPESYIVALRVIRLPEQEVVTSYNYTIPRLDKASVSERMKNRWW